MNYHKVTLALLLSLAISSCSITERMIINENGSGKFAYDIDASKMISMMGSIIKNVDKEGTKNSDTISKKPVDSTFTFKQIFDKQKDSIAKLSTEEQAKLKKMERFSVRTVVDEQKGIMNYSLFTDFTSISELQEVMSPLKTMQSIASGGKQEGMSLAPPTINDETSTHFFYDGKIFKKTVTKIEKKKDVPQTQEATDEPLSEEDFGSSIKSSSDMFYAQSSFKLIYQFPKPVKKIAFANALFSEDRKTITIEYSLKEYIENPEKLNFEVIFE